MNSHYLNFRLLILFIITSLFLISCSTKPELIKSSDLKNIQFKSSYTLEGKFKASIGDIKETGYFVIKKIENSIELRIGKSYLFPEKKLNFFLDENINIDKLFNNTEVNYKYKYSGQAIPVKSLLKILLGQKEQLTSSWIVYYPEGLKSFNRFNLPKKIILNNNGIELEIINKKYIE